MPRQETLVETACHGTPRHLAALLLAAAVCAQCGGRDRGTPPTPTSPVLPVSPPFTPPAAPEVLVGAGDIAMCNQPGAEFTAKLLDGITGTVFTAGDNAYLTGSRADYQNCYEPTWGRH